MLVGCCVGDSKNHFITVPDVSKQETSVHKGYELGSTVSGTVRSSRVNERKPQLLIWLSS